MKKRFCITILVMAVVMTGCASGPDLSRVHRNMEAEYLAGLLLKYDADYDEMLDYDRSILNPTPTPVPTRKPVNKPTNTASGGTVTGGQSASDSDDGQQKTYISLDEMGDIQGITISQQTYELKGSYGSNFAVVSPQEGNRLLIVKFRLKNGNSRTKQVNMSNANMSYSLEIDGQNMGTPLKTMLPNDLQFFRDKISAGKSQEAVLIFEISKKQKVKDAKLDISKGDRTAQVSLR